MNRATLVLVGSAVLMSAGVWAGCGSSDGSSILGGNDGGSGDGSSTGNSDGGASTDGGTTGNDAATGGNDAGGGAGLDGSTAYDGGGPGGNTTTEPCGLAFCSIATQVCCVTNVQNMSTSACVTGTTCPVPDAGGGGNPPDVTVLKCTGQANCAAGSICCVSPTMTGAASACVVGTTCGANSAQLCDPGAAPTGCPADAGMGSACSSANIGDWGLKPPFATCGGKGN